MAEVFHSPGRVCSVGVFAYICLVQSRKITVYARESSLCTVTLDRDCGHRFAVLVKRRRKTKLVVRWCDDVGGETCIFLPWRQKYTAEELLYMSHDTVSSRGASMSMRIGVSVHAPRFSITYDSHKPSI